MHCSIGCSCDLYMYKIQIYTQHTLHNYPQSVSMFCMAWVIRLPQHSTAYYCLLVSHLAGKLNSVSAQSVKGFHRWANDQQVHHHHHPNSFKWLLLNSFNCDNRQNGQSWTSLIWKLNHKKFNSQKERINWEGNDSSLELRETTSILSHTLPVNIGCVLGGH